MAKQIWIVDDNADSRALARVILGSSTDYEISEVASGQDAIDMLDRACPDLLILDISMPGVNGFDVLRAIRSRSDVCHVPVVAYTSFAAHHERLRFVSYGFDDCVVKPIVDEEQLLQPVAQLLAS